MDELVKRIRILERKIEVDNPPRTPEAELTYEIALAETVWKDLPNFRCYVVMRIVLEGVDLLLLIGQIWVGHCSAVCS